MSEKPEFFVGQDVFVVGHGVLRPGKIARITPTGRLRLEGSDTDYGKDGYHKPAHGWASDAVWLKPATPELVAKHRLEVRRNAVERRIRELGGTSFKQNSAGDLEAVFKLLTEALNILNNPKQKAAP